MIDTAAKRFMAMDLGSPVPVTMPIPDGTIDAADRLWLMDLYGFGEVVPAGPSVGIRVLAMTDQLRGLGALSVSAGFAVRATDSPRFVATVSDVGL